MVVLNSTMPGRKGVNINIAIDKHYYVKNMNLLNSPHYICNYECFNFIFLDWEMFIFQRQQSTSKLQPAWERETLLCRPQLKRSTIAAWKCNNNHFNWYLLENTLSILTRSYNSDLYSDLYSSLSYKIWCFLEDLKVMFICFCVKLYIQRSQTNWSVTRETSYISSIYHFCW